MPVFHVCVNGTPYQYMVGDTAVKVCDAVAKGLGHCTLQDAIGAGQHVSAYEVPIPKHLTGAEYEAAYLNSLPPISTPKPEDYAKDYKLFTLDFANLEPQVVNYVIQAQNAEKKYSSGFLGDFGSDAASYTQFDKLVAAQTWKAHTHTEKPTQAETTAPLEAPPSVKTLVSGDHIAFGDKFYLAKFSFALVMTQKAIDTAVQHGGLVQIVMDIEPPKAVPPPGQESIDKILAAKPKTTKLSRLQIFEKLQAISPLCGIFRMTDTGEYEGLIRRSGSYTWSSDRVFVFKAEHVETWNGDLSEYETKLKTGMQAAKKWLNGERFAIDLTDPDQPLELGWQQFFTSPHSFYNANVKFKVK